MKRKLIVVFAVLFALSITGTALAGNLADVPAKHWAYDSVANLAKVGLIEGYSDGTFKGDRTITRYEMAVLVSKAMDNYSKADDANKAEILKLTTEFAKELDKMGARLTVLEKNQPVLKFSGNFDMRYTVQHNSDPATPTGVTPQQRFRLNAMAKVDDKTSFGMRVVTKSPNMPTVDNSTVDFNTSTFTTFGTNNATFGYLDRYFGTTQVGKVNLVLGRQQLNTDPMGMLIDSGSSFDALSMNTKSGKFGFAASRGRWVKNVTYKTSTAAAAAFYAKYTSVDVDSLSVSYKNGKLDSSLWYSTLNNNKNNIALKKYWVGYANYLFNPQFSVATQYVKDTVSSDANAIGLVKLLYGDQVLKAKGQKNVSVTYYNAGHNSLITRFTPFDNPGLDNVNDDYRAMDLGVNYAFSNNFSTEAHVVKVTDRTDSNKSYDFYRILTHMKF